MGYLLDIEPINLYVIYVHSGNILDIFVTRYVPLNIIHTITYSDFMMAVEDKMAVFETK